MSNTTYNHLHWIGMMKKFRLREIKSCVEIHTPGKSGTEIEL